MIAGDMASIQPTQLPRPRPAMPELALMLAILAQAVRDVLAPQAWRERRMQAREGVPVDRALASIPPPIAAAAADAWRWFHDDARDWPCAFAVICDVLGVAPEWVRRRLVALGAAPRHEAA